MLGGKAWKKRQASFRGGRQRFLKNPRVGATNLKGELKKIPLRSRTRSRRISSGGA